MPTSLFETFLMMCRSTSALSPVVSMQFSPNYLITMTAHIAYYQAFWGVLIDMIVELLDLSIKPFDNQTES